MANRIGALIFLFVGIWKMNVAGDESPVWFWWLWIGVCVYGVIFPYRVAKTPTMISTTWTNVKIATRRTQLLASTFDRYCYPFNNEQGLSSNGV